MTATPLLERIKSAAKRHSQRWKDVGDRHADLLNDTTQTDKQSAAQDEIPGIDSRERRIIKTLQFCLFFAMGWFILLNVRPYVGIVEQGFGQFQDTGIFAMALKWPVVGWLLGQGIDLTMFVIGLILWATLQLFELAPTVMSDSPQMILSTLARIKNWRKLTVRAEDSAIARQLKTKYNAIPEAHLETANLFRAGAYLADGAVCLNFYAPIEGGWANLETMFVSGDFSYVQWDQAVYIIVTLFAVELLYFGFRFVTGLLETHFANN